MKLFGFLLIFIINKAYADLQVIPTRIQLNEKNKLATLMIRNKENTTREYVARLTYYKMDSFGKMIELTGHSEGDASSAGFIRFSPRRIKLRPGEEQVVRVKAAPPSNLVSGDYRCHIKFTPIEESVRSDQGGSEKMSFNLRPQVSVAVPIFFTQGEPERTFEFRSLKFFKKEGKSFLEAELFNKNSKTILSGDLKVSLFDEQLPEKEEILYEVNGLNSYVPIYPLKVEILDPAEKKITNPVLRVSFKSKFSPGENQQVYAEKKL